MPNRILRDWTDSEPINLLSWQSEVFFTRLIMKVDDFGRFSANPKLLRSLLFPIRDGVRDADISRDLAECEKAGLLAVYEADGKPYLQIEKFGNTPRAKESKYPAPASNLQANACNLKASASKCMQMHANAPVTVTVTETEFVTDSPLPPTGGVEEVKGRDWAGEFASFWAEYPESRKKNRYRVESAWSAVRHHLPPINELQAALCAFKASQEWKREGGKFIPSPETWLTEHRWQDAPAYSAPKVKLKPEVDEADAFRWRSTEYPESLEVHPTAATFPFRVWPESIRKEYLTRK